MKAQANLIRYGAAATEPMEIKARYLFTAEEAAAMPEERRYGYMIIECDAGAFSLHILAQHAAALAHAILDAQRKRSQELVARAGAAVKDASNG